MRLEPSLSVSSSIISSYTQLHPLDESLLPCMPALVLEGPDMTIQPSTKAFMARSVRRVLPLPFGPQKIKSRVCSPNCSKLQGDTPQGQRAGQGEGRKAVGTYQ